MRPDQTTSFSYRYDKAIPAFDETKLLLVMDAQCALCSAAAKRIARLDKHDEVRIAPAQSALGRALLVHYGMDPDDPKSWLLVDNGAAWGSLEATVRLFPKLNRAYSVLRIFSLLPYRVQDWLYARIARNRYAIFGRTDMCALPDEALQARLIQ
ncbi:MAG: DCC1-like thiol-disulfide oxidoreductase family protein [Pseudomonadota bacterium]